MMALLITLFNIYQLDLKSTRPASDGRDVAQKDSQRPPSGTNHASFVLGQPGHYRKCDIEALYAHWKKEYLSTEIFGNVNRMRPESGEGSPSQQRSKDKGRKLDKPHNVRKRKDSRSSLQGESNSNGRFEDEDDDDDDDDDDEDVDGDEDEREEDEDEAETDRNPDGAASTSRSSKSKRGGKGKGKGKDSLEPEGKKRKKLKPVKDTRKHACSKCGKRFSRPSQRDTHYLTHTGLVKLNSTRCMTCACNESMIGILY